jgi:hypothetical protein
MYRERGNLLVGMQINAATMESSLGFLIKLIKEHQMFHNLTTEYPKETKPLDHKISTLPHLLQYYLQ